MNRLLLGMLIKCGLVILMLPLITQVSSKMCENRYNHTSSLTPPWFTRSCNCYRLTLTAVSNTIYFLTESRSTDYFVRPSVRPSSKLSDEQLSLLGAVVREKIRVNRELRFQTRNIFSLGKRHVLWYPDPDPTLAVHNVPRLGGAVNP